MDLRSFRLACHIEMGAAGEFTEELWNTRRHPGETKTAIPDSMAFDAVQRFVVWVCGKLGRDVRLECIAGQVIAQWALPGQLPPVHAQPRGDLRALEEPWTADPGWFRGSR